jgi:hypothetical protein
MGINWKERKKENKVDEQVEPKAKTIRKQGNQYPLSSSSVP